MLSSGIKTPDILLATDFSDSSQRALICTKHLARLRGLTVRSIHVIDLADSAGNYNRCQDNALRGLRRVRRELRLAGVKESANVINAGTEARAICDAARRYQVKLLVVGLSGDAFVISAALGSVAKGVLQKAPCPVLSVGIRTPDPPTHKFDKILYVSEADPPCLGNAIAAWPIKSRLDAPHYAILQPGIAAADIPDTPGIRPVEYQGGAAYILNQAKQIEPDLIVFGLKAGSYLDSFTPSAFAYKLIGGAPCPVLTVRQAAIPVPIAAVVQAPEPVPDPEPVSTAEPAE